MSMTRRDKVGELERLVAIGEYYGRKHHGGGPMFGGGRGRRRRGDVRASVLLLLAEQPRNGYQLMQEIEDRSRGRWRPSPGSVYPTLAQLEDEGLIRATEVDGAKLYELTDQGREHLHQHAHGHVPWADEDDPAASAEEELRSLLHGLHLAVMQVSQAGDSQQVAQAAQLLDETRRNLYRILAADREALSSGADG
jgi:DNA-binding PadR family transcriptional regulator